jgi:dethiobiotin synthetase
MGLHLNIAVTGTDTGVGKTAVMALLAAGLRARGRRVWLFKPVACGGWDGSTAEDGRRLRALAGDDQDPASICPFEFAAECAPHLAALAAGRRVGVADLASRLAALHGAHDLLIEGAGGLLAPLAAGREGLPELLADRQVPLLIVTRPDLGTLNHTALTVAVARTRGLPVLGLVLNRARPPLPGAASDSAAGELAGITGLPLLADLPHGDLTREVAVALADAVLAAEARRR